MDFIFTGGVKGNFAVDVNQIDFRPGIAQAYRNVVTHHPICADFRARFAERMETTGGWKNSFFYQSWRKTRKMVEEFDPLLADRVMEEARRTA